MKKYNPFRVFSQPINFTIALFISITTFSPLIPFFLWKWQSEVNDLILIAWLPGQELLTTGSVNSTYPYPMWTLVTMLPFAMIDKKLGMILWLILSIFLLMASLAVFTKLFDWDMTIGNFSFLAAAFLLYFPMFLSLVMGQLSAFSLLVLALVVYFFLYKKWVWLGVAIGLSFIKPQVMPLLAGLLLLWSILQRRWQVLIGFFATIAVMVLISLPFISNPSQLIGSGIEEHLVTYLGVTSTIWAMFINWGTSWHVPFVISLGLLGWVAWSWFPYLAGKELSADRVRFLISLAVIINLLVIPYSWIYNLALLLLPFAYSFSRALKIQGWEKFAWIAALFTSLHVFAFITVAKYGYDFALEKSQWYHIVHALIFLGVVTALEYRTNPEAR